MSIERCGDAAFDPSAVIGAGFYETQASTEYEQDWAVRVAIHANGYECAYFVIYQTLTTEDQASAKLDEFLQWLRKELVE